MSPNNENSTVRLKVRVARIEQQAESIRSYELAPTGMEVLPPFEAGAHLQVVVPGGAIRCYSLCNEASERSRYVIAVQREAAGRGGSRAFYDEVRTGDVLTVSAPQNSFVLRPAPHSVLIAGGIGITPLLAMARTLAARGKSFELHYCTRSQERTAFREVLRGASLAPHVRLYHDGGDPSRGLDVGGMLGSVIAGTQVYCCGPAGLLRAVQASAAAVGLPDTAIHFESFGGDPLIARNRAFAVRLRRSGKTLSVPPENSLLQVLREHGVPVSTSCEAGVCGACVTPVLDGEPDHRDQSLTSEERVGGKCMAVCVSRARSESLEIDL